MNNDQSRQTARIRRLRWAVLAMAVSGLLAASIAYASDWHWYADLFSHLRPQYCVWLILAAIGAWFLKHRLAGLLAVAGLIVNGVALAPYALPWREPPSSSSSRDWTIVSINLLHGNQQVDRVVDYVRKTGADVVVFQEISSRWAADLEQLSDLYPYRFSKPRKDSFGIAIFSREKPVEMTSRTLADRPADVALLASWESEGRGFNVAGIHPDKPDKEFKARRRATYFSNLVQWCREKELANEPVIVIGDYNATPWSSSMRSFVRETGLRNVNQGTIFGASWNVWQPQRLLIDHALLSSHWRLIDHKIGPPIGSDHRPLMVRVALRPADGSSIAPDNVAPN